MFLVANGSLLNSVAAECWKVPDFLGIGNTDDEEDQGFWVQNLIAAAKPTKLAYKILTKKKKKKKITTPQKIPSVCTLS